MSAPLSWTPWVESHLAGLGYPLSSADRATVEPMWRCAWAADVEAAADRREVIPLPVARSYGRWIGAGASRNLRSAENAVGIAAALLPAVPVTL